MMTAIPWGMLLLGTLTYFIARARGAAPVTEIAKHLCAAVVVIGLSKLIDQLISTFVS